MPGARRLHRPGGARRAGADLLLRTAGPSVVEAPVEARLAGEQYDDDGALALLQPLVSPEEKRLADELRTAHHGAERWRDVATIWHLFFHSLIVDPSTRRGSSTATRTRRAATTARRRSPSSGGDSVLHPFFDPEAG